MSVGIMTRVQDNRVVGHLILMCATICVNGKKLLEDIRRNGRLLRLSDIEISLFCYRSMDYVFAQ